MSKNEEFAQLHLYYLTRHVGLLEENVLTDSNSLKAVLDR